MQRLTEDGVPYWCQGARFGWDRVWYLELFDGRQLRIMPSELSDYFRHVEKYWMKGSNVQDDYLDAVLYSFGQEFGKEE